LLVPGRAITLASRSGIEHVALRALQPVPQSIQPAEMRQAVFEQKHLTARDATGFGEEPHSVRAREVVQDVAEDHGVERAGGEGQGLAIIGAKLYIRDGAMQRPGEM